MKVLTIREVAEILKLHPRTVAKMARSGQIPASRIGRVWRFDEGAVMNWFNAQLAAVPANGSASSEQPRLWNGNTRVSELIGEDQVQFLKDPQSKKGVLEALATLAARTHKVADYSALVESLSDREQMCPTAFEGGVAFPHPRHPLANLDRPVLAALVAGQGVDFGAPDGNPTQVFVLVCSPDDRTHVKILSHLVRMFRPKDAVSRLSKCQTPTKIVREIEKLEQHLIIKTEKTDHGH